MEPTTDFTMTCCLCHCLIDGNDEYIGIGRAVRHLKGKCPPTKSRYQDLFNHMSQDHNLTLTESEMNDIIQIVQRMKE